MAESSLIHLLTDTSSRTPRALQRETLEQGSNHQWAYSSYGTCQDSAPPKSRPTQGSWPSGAPGQPTISPIPALRHPGFSASHPSIQPHSPADQHQLWDTTDTIVIGLRKQPYAPAGKQYIWNPQQCNHPHQNLGLPTSGPAITLAPLKLLSQQSCGPAQPISIYAD